MPEVRSKTLARRGLCVGPSKLCTQANANLLTTIVLILLLSSFLLPSLGRAQN